MSLRHRHLIQLGAAVLLGATILGVFALVAWRVPRYLGAAVVVLLRRTFGAFDPAERRQIMSLLVGRSLDRRTGFGSDVHEQRAGDVLVTVRHLLGVPISTTAPEAVDAR